MTLEAGSDLTAITLRLLTNRLSLVLSRALEYRWSEPANQIRVCGCKI
jgi:hypothetical protein